MLCTKYRAGNSSRKEQKLVLEVKEGFPEQIIYKLEPGELPLNMDVKRNTYLQVVRMSCASYWSGGGQNHLEELFSIDPGWRQFRREESKGLKVSRS